MCRAGPTLRVHTGARTSTRMCWYGSVHTHAHTGKGGYVCRSAGEVATLLPKASLPLDAKPETSCRARRRRAPPPWRPPSALHPPPRFGHQISPRGRSVLPKCCTVPASEQRARCAPWARPPHSGSVGRARMGHPRVVAVDLQGGAPALKTAKEAKQSPGGLHTQGERQVHGPPWENRVLTGSK